MIYTALFGDRALGSGGVDARAWINIGGFSFQTSEAVKIAFILTLPSTWIPCESGVGLTGRCM